MPAKYRLYPGPVICLADGQRHYISAAQLARLYGVQMQDCVVAGSYQEQCQRGELVNLYPSTEGNYSLPD